ncbi:MAG: WYL domain-containing protein [Halothiobacillus sp.]
MANRDDVADAAGLKWDLRQRLKLLEGTLLLTGWVRTQALVDTFGISRAQASKDFAIYMGLRPDNLAYNKSRKYYEATSEFVPLLLTGKASELLDALQSLQMPDAPVVTLAATVPAIALVKPMERELDWHTLRVVSSALCQQRKFSVAYQSMNRPEPTELTLSPHSLVYSGYRWHIRAYSDTHREYRDFVLARMRGRATLLDKPAVSAKDDTAWKTEVAIVIAPHPDLPAAQQAILAEDYGMVDGQSIQSIRQALVPYFLRLMQLEPERQHPDPKVQQIVLLNRAEIEPLLWSN